jgi:membrane protein required for colicin V production
MTTFDFIIYSILILSFLASLSRGFVKEVFSLLCYLGSFLMAIKYQGSLSQLLMENITSKPIAKVVAFFAIYVLTAIIISLMGKVIRAMLMSGTKLSTIDRLLGGVVGFCKGGIIVIAVIFPLQFFPEISKKVARDSQTIPYLVEVLTFVNKNISNFHFQNPLTAISIDDTKEKLKDLKVVQKVGDQLEEFKKKLPNISKNSISEEKQLDEYTKDDLQKLNDILKSVTKK